MKKLLLVVAIVAVGFTANAQDGQFNVGVNASLPLGDTADTSPFGFNVEANYLFEVSDEFKVGPSVSYAMLLGKETSQSDGAGTTVTVKGDNISFLPVAVAGRFNASEDFILGADLGYGVSLEKEGKGGFYYRPVVAYNVADNTALQLSYSGIMISGEEGGEDSTASTLSLGVMFSF